MTYTNYFCEWLLVHEFVSMYINIYTWKLVYTKRFGLCPF